MKSRAAAWLALFLLLSLVSAAFGAQQEVVGNIDVKGARRIPVETVKSRMFTRPGDVYDEASLERDFSSLWNTGYYDDLRFEKEETSKGVTIHVYVKEKPTIRTIDYVGLNAVSKSDVLDRFKKDKVSLTVENQYDPTKLKKAEVELRQILSEHGRQFATIRTEVRPIPPAAVGITFNIKEGPRVKVGKIKFKGNEKLKSRELRSAMKNLRPIGIPHSIFFENLFARTYDSTKLEEDTERVRQNYQEHGYFKVVVEDPETNLHDTKPGFLRVPFKHHNPGKAIDLTIPVEEGAQYRLGSITFKNNKIFNSEKGMRSAFAIKDGDIFDTSKIRKGLDELTKAAGALGYIKFTGVPSETIDDAKKSVSLVIDIDEGSQYFVRRIEFTGNTTTRDKVIRRELPLEEGNAYNSRLWEFGLQRLNQLQYFEELKTDQATDIKQNDTEHTVDLTLKLHEKGKNSIGLTGGVSGLAGAFIGLNYSTNNLLGRGETLAVEADTGSTQRNLRFSFTEPYLFDKPYNTTVSVFDSRYRYNQAQQLSILNNRQLNLSQGVLDTLQNYTQSVTGFSVGVSYPLKRSLKRVGIAYSLDRTSITTFSTASSDLFQFLAFRQVSGPNALEGVITSKLIPSFTYNGIDYPQRPHSGRSLYAAAEISGIGGNVAAIRPVVEFKQFIPMRGWHHDKAGRQTFGYRLLGSYITGYRGLVAPPQERSYLGGDTDLRGFDTRTLSPYIFLDDVVQMPLTNPDGSTVPLDPTNPRRGVMTIPVPIKRITIPGGDTSIVTNVEYRWNLIGPVTLAAFADTGFDMSLNSSQLRLTDTQINTLNTTAFGCTTITPFVGCTGGIVPGHPGGLPVYSGTLNTVPGTNYLPRMSTGLELQVILPIVNAPFRVYYAYNPLRMDTVTSNTNIITRSMFPAGAAGDFTYASALQNFAPEYQLKEPRKTFRFTVATTF